MLSLIKNNNLSYSCSKLIFEQYIYPDDVVVITRLELLKNILIIDEEKKTKRLKNILI